MIEYRKIMIGRLMHKVPTGHLIARMEPLKKVPRLGVKVVDKSGREIGVLADIIGPVDGPFAVIKPVNGVEAVEGDRVVCINPCQERSWEEVQAAGKWAEEGSWQRRWTRQAEWKVELTLGYSL